MQGTARMTPRPVCLVSDHALEHVEGWHRAELRNHVPGALDGEEGEVIAVVGHVARDLRVDRPRAPGLDDVAADLGPGAAGSSPGPVRCV